MFCSTHILYIFLAFPVPVAVPALVECSSPDHGECQCPWSCLWFSARGNPPTGWSTKGFPFPHEFAGHCGKHFSLQSVPQMLCCARAGGLGPSLGCFRAAAHAEQGNRDLGIAPGLSSAPCSSPECFPHSQGFPMGRALPSAQGGTERIFPTISNHGVRPRNHCCLPVPGQPIQTPQIFMAWIPILKFCLSPSLCLRCLFPLP